MHADEHIISVSALQHYLFCPRQCALIHVDGLWAENQLTIEGALQHQRADSPGYRTRNKKPAVTHQPHAAVRIVRAMPLVSHTLGLIGKADYVEFPLTPDGLPNGPPKPIEHKHGKPKRIDADRIQLCAQAMCLEEMLHTLVPIGELFYNAIRRRETVVFTDKLRQLTKNTIRVVRHLLETNSTPSADPGSKCRSCSLKYLCLPTGTSVSRDPRRYLSRSLAASFEHAAEKDRFPS